MRPRDENKPTPPADETDDRFPSGPWVGFWLQRRVPGRQWMRDLNLRFAAAKVEGSGADRVGPFAVTGAYDTDSGRVRLVKHYLSAHSLTYEGQNQGDGQWLWGVWTLREPQLFDRGGFHIWPKGVPDPTGQQLAAEQDVPAEELLATTR
jgi:hypothetical protein